MNEGFVGIDFGGSTLKAVRTDERGKVIQTHVADAGGKMQRDTLAEIARQAINMVSGHNQVTHIGLAFGGAIQPDGTMMVNSTNLPNIANLPLIPFFEKKLACKVRIENDARAAMRGEAWSGSAQGNRSAMTLTFGTGIGAGVMLDRRIVEGAHGKAGEIGVWKLAASQETYEDLCAPGRVERRTGRKFSDMMANDEVGCMIALSARAIANAHLLLDLETIVLLGGITELGEPLREAIEKAFREECLEDYQSGLSIKIGEHGPFAGAVGAASLWSGG